MKRIVGLVILVIGLLIEAVVADIFKLPVLSVVWVAFGADVVLLGLWLLLEKE